MFVSETPDMDKDYKRSPSLDSLEPEFHHFQSLSLSPDRQISPPIPSTSKQVNSPAPEENQIEPTVTFEGDDLANEESVRHQQEVASRLGLLGHQQKGQKSNSKGGRLSYPERVRRKRELLCQQQEAQQQEEQEREQTDEAYMGGKQKLNDSTLFNDAPAFSTRAAKRKATAK
jgi:hypothetical protein